jgi:succinate dehydrogenase / fumarate reductase cytochrome b subunit
MLQTFGLNHPRYNKLISALTVAVPIAFLVIFGGIPIYFMTGAGAGY